MVLAKRKHFDILDNDEFVVVLMEHSPIDNIKKILFVALGEEQHGFGVSFRGLQKTLAIRIFAQAFENGLDCARELV